jgi:hypothetical protein
MASFKVLESIGEPGCFEAIKRRWWSSGSNLCSIRW